MRPWGDIFAIDECPWGGGGGAPGVAASAPLGGGGAPGVAAFGGGAPMIPPLAVRDNAGLAPEGGRAPTPRSI